MEQEPFRMKRRRNETENKNGSVGRFFFRNSDSCDTLALVASWDKFLGDTKDLGVKAHVT